MPQKRRTNGCRRDKLWGQHRKITQLKDSVGVIGKKQSLLCSLLNVDGLSHSSYEDVKQVLDKKKSDVCIILESKRRF